MKLNLPGMKGCKASGILHHTNIFHTRYMNLDMTCAQHQLCMKCEQTNKQAFHGCPTTLIKSSAKTSPPLPSCMVSTAGHILSMSAAMLQLSCVASQQTCLLCCDASFT